MTDQRDNHADFLERPARRPWRWAIAGGAILGVIGAVVVLVWFQPQKLLIDDRVEETIPGVAAPSPTSGPDPAVASPTSAAPPSTSPLVLARGEFVSLDHGTSGATRVLELADGRRIVRLEGLDTDNGPDLYVYLSANPSGGGEGAFDDDFISLGRLKGNQGDQNYDLATDAKLGRFQSVVIWCDRFDSAFGAADLMFP